MSSISGRCSEDNHDLSLDDNENYNLEDDDHSQSHSKQSQTGWMFDLQNTLWDHHQNGNQSRDNGEGNLYLWDIDSDADVSILENFKINVQAIAQQDSDDIGQAFDTVFNDASQVKNLTLRFNYESASESHSGSISESESTSTSI